MNKLLLLSLGLTSVLMSCGARQNETADLKTAYTLPLNTTTRAGAFALRDKLLQIWNSESGIGSLATSDILSVVAMADDQRSLIERAYANPLTVDCTKKPCTIGGHGAKVHAATKVVLEGISSPYVNIGSEVTAKLAFNGGDANVFTICSLNGISVQKLFLEFPVLAIQSKFQGTNATVVADIRSSSGTFICK